MLVESVSVKNFKLLGDFSLEGLRRVTLLGGDNGCGKTTLLEAVFLCFDRWWDKSHPSPILTPLRNAAIMNEDAFAHLFHEGNIGAPIIMSCVAEGISYAVKIEPAPKSGSEEIAVPFANMQKANGNAPLETRVPQQILVEHTEEGKMNSRAVVTLNDSGMQTRIDKTDTPLKFAQIVKDGLVASGFSEDPDNLSNLEINGEKNKALDALRLVAPQAVDITVASIRKTPLMFVRIGQAKRMTPSTLLGAGAQKALSLALALHSHNDGLILFDEVTVGWHYSRLVNLWRMIFRVCKERGHQFIASTHSDESLTAFVKAAEAEKFEDECCYIRLDPPQKGDPPGKISAAYFDYKLLRASRELRVEVR